MICSRLWEFLGDRIDKNPTDFEHLQKKKNITSICPARSLIKSNPVRWL